MNLHKSLLATLLMTGAATALPAFPAQPDAVDPLPYLAAAKQASGGAAWDAIATLHLSGIARQGGQDGVFDTLTDLQQVRSVQRSVIGPTVDVRGWDGKAGWSADGSGQVQPGTGGESVAAGIAIAYRAAYAFFWPRRFPAKLEYAGQKSQAGRGYDVLKITPKGADPFELWLDRRTHLIAREVMIGGSQPSTLTLDDYRAVDGVLLPFSTRESTGEAELDTQSTTRSATTGAAMPASAFAPPAPPVEPDPFPQGTDRVSVPMQLIDNHIFIPAAVNGGPSQAFIFDTGAITILDKKRALAMDIQSEGALSGSGFGSAAVDLNKARVQSITIGAMTLPAQSVLTLDTTAMGKTLDVDYAGFLGLEVAQRAVVVIDYEGQVLTLVKPSAFKPPASAIAVALKFNDNLPVVDAVVDGIAGEFEIDTGAGTPLTLMAPFSAQHQLAEKYHATRHVQTGGAGGVSNELLARAGTLQIGGATVEHPLTLLGIDLAGAAAATRTAGNIGSGLLRKFTVTLDYAHRMMYLEPNRQLTVADVYDRSGMGVKRDADGGAVLGFIVPGGGAELAGLKKGDHILTVNGADIHAIPLPDLRRTLKGPAGTEVVLSVLSQGAPPREVKVVLSDLI